uniref:ABC transporter permease n=1 Tax=Phenylobacterium glaciei TaxID=2803784 RepID=A0A974P0I9_9CAUL|nr:ABC transporter permease [Phenylobacterium glaciei]
MMVGEWRAHPGRVVTAALAIAIGVALGFAVHLINGSAQNELAQAVRTVNADADLQVHSTTPLGFNETLYPALARAPGIAAASPVVELSGRFGTGPSRSLEGGGLTVLGSTLRAAAVTPTLLGGGAAPPTESAGGFVPEGLFDPRAIVLSPAALAASGRKVGEAVTITAAGRNVDFVVAGVLSGAASERQVAVLDIATAQWLFGSLGRLQRIDLKFAPGVNPATVEAALRAPAGRRPDRHGPVGGQARRQPHQGLPGQSGDAGHDGPADRRLPGLFGPVAVGGPAAPAIRPAPRSGP